MQYDQDSVLTTLHRVQSFLRTHADRLGGLATSGASTKIDETAVSLEARGREQACHTLAARVATIKRNAARRALVTGHMYPIAHAAAAEFENYEALPVFHMPRSDVDDQGLADVAREMAFNARLREPAFSRSLASANFAADLTSAVRTLTQALEERAGAVAGREAATAALAVETRIARKRLRVISRFVMGVIASDRELVVEWNSAKQIAKAPARSRPTRSTATLEADTASARRRRRHSNAEAE